jgi:hypothetical protein
LISIYSTPKEEANLNCIHVLSSFLRAFLDTGISNTSVKFNLMILPPGLEKISFGFRRCQMIHARMSDGDSRIISGYDYPDIILQRGQGFCFAQEITTGISIQMLLSKKYVYRCKKNAMLPNMP